MRYSRIEDLGNVLSELRSEVVLSQEPILTPLSYAILIASFQVTTTLFEARAFW